VHSYDVLGFTRVHLKMRNDDLALNYADIFELSAIIHATNFSNVISSFPLEHKLTQAT
jgi:hypothetical protein